jgi:hypothetical protein
MYLFSLVKTVSALCLVLVFGIKNLISRLLFFLQLKETDVVKEKKYRELRSCHLVKSILNLRKSLEKNLFNKKST